MEPPTTKSEILARNLAARQAWLDATAALSESQLLQPGPGNSWSVRDVIAHLAVDKRWFAAQLRAVLQSREPTPEECFGANRPYPPGVDMSTQDGRNAYGQWLMAGATLAEVIALEEQTATARDAALSAVPEVAFEAPFTIEDLGHTGRIRPARPGEWSSPLWRWAQGNGWHHYEEHTASLGRHGS